MEFMQNCGLSGGSGHRLYSPRWPDQSVVKRIHARQHGILQRADAERAYLLRRHIAPVSR